MWQFVRGVVGGWVRSITVSDTDPGLTITQSGSGDGLKVDTTGGSTTILRLVRNGDRFVVSYGNPAQIAGPGNGFQINGCLIAVSSDANRDVLMVKGAASQVGPLFEGQSSGGTALFRIESDGDINSLNAGGHKQSFGFMQQNVSASQSAVAMDVLGLEGNTEVVMPFAGSVLGIGVASNAARTSGTLTVDVTVNGVAMGLEAQLDASNTQYHSATQAKDTDDFNAGDRLGVKITTSADWAPTTADIVVTVIVEM